MPNQIPLDPKLRKGFDDTPNEQRTKAELDAWWDHPYGITLPDGQIMVRCLNGGAWDRSTQLGVASDYEQACILAEKKQAAWVRFRGAPLYLMDTPKSALVIMPQRPDQAMRKLVDVETPEQAEQYLAKHFPEYARQIPPDNTQPTQDC